MSNATLTVLIPTFDHGPSLRWAVASALDQSEAVLEVLVVGDGAPPETRELAQDLASRERRVTFHDFPKGERHGEAHRHAALQHARGDWVAYLADDDLWLPDHAERLLAAAQNVEFVHSLSVSVSPEGELDLLPADLADPVLHAAQLAGRNRIALSTAAHSLAAYRSLPRGWCPAPEGRFTTLHFWCQFLRVPGRRARTVPVGTALRFPSVERQGWTPERRARELEDWFRVSREPGGGTRLRERMSGSALRKLVAAEREREALSGTWSPGATGLGEAPPALDLARQTLELPAAAPASVTLASLPCGGSVDRVTAERGRLELRGWAGGGLSPLPAREVWIFMGERRLARIVPSGRRPDVAAQLGATKERFGFEVALPLDAADPILEAQIALVARLEDGALALLRFPTDSAWGPVAPASPPRALDPDALAPDPRHGWIPLLASGQGLLTGVAGGYLDLEQPPLIGRVRAGEIRDVLRPRPVDGVGRFRIDAVPGEALIVLACEGGAGEEAWRRLEMREPRRGAGRSMTLRGWVDSVEARGPLWVLRGWSADAALGLLPYLLEVRVRGEVVGRGWVGRPRSDVVRSLLAPEAAQAGFELHVARSAAARATDMDVIALDAEGFEVPLART